MEVMGKDIQSPLSAHELLLLGDIGPCELIKGELRMNSPAGGRHGRIAAEVVSLLRNYVKAKGLGRVYAAETGFLISQKPDTVRAPDAAFVEDKLEEEEPLGYLPYAPDLAVEVVSPHDRKLEIEEKVKEWLSSGARIVWLIDPGTNTIQVYRRGQAVLSLSERDILSGEEVIPGFAVAVAAVFK